MENKKLSLVTSQQVPGGFAIVENGDSSTLASISSDGTFSGIYLKNDNSRPLRCSELNNKLKKRKYHIWDLKFIPCQLDNETVSVVSEGADFSDFKIKKLDPFSDIIDSDIPNIETTSDTVGFNYSTHFTGSDKIKTELENIKSTDPSISKTWLDSYKNTISNINFNSSGISLTIIDRNSDDYTDTIDFRNLINYSRQARITAHVILEVGFTIKINSTYYPSTKIIEFNLFNYSDTAESINIQDFIIEEDGIIVEFIDGIMRTTMSDEDITECIINNCIVDYGKLN